MGGGFYDDDVGVSVRSTSDDHFRHTAEMAQIAETQRKCHKSLDPKGVVRECCDGEGHLNTTPIAILLDVTRSRGKDPLVVFGKLPMLIGQTKMNSYVEDPEICFAAVGDATSDRAPFQIGQFESDNRLDTQLANLWIEEGGGGTGQESYQLAAFGFARHTKLDAKLRRGKKGYLFIFGDEGFYPVVDRGEVKRVFGDNLATDIPSADIFRELQETYRTFFIFPRQSWEKRKSDIDAEIKQRLDEAGGMYQDVDIRFSLIWNNRNDLDLHVKTPQGHHIYFGNKRIGSGELDVDRNVNGETTKPVENTRWPRGKAPRGNYEVWVENYNFHETSRQGTDFKVEIEINGKFQTFTGRTKDRATHDDSRVDVGTFFYDPNEREAEVDENKRYAGYNDETVKAQWATVLPTENILMIDDAKAAVDIILGVLCLTNETRTLPAYLEDMKARGQTEKRIEEVKASLANLADLVGSKRVDVDTSAAKPQRSRRGASSRLG